MNEKERTCPNCGEVAVQEYETGSDRIREFQCWNENCRCVVFRAPFRSDKNKAELRADGGIGIEERTLNPETHIDPDDYLNLIYFQDAAIHFYLKDDKEWWVAHGPAEQPTGEFDGPWLFWTTYPSGPWELDYLTEEFAKFHIGELWYGPVGDRKHSIHRARIVPIEDAPEFVREVVE